MKYLVKNEKEAYVLLELLDCVVGCRWYSGHEPSEYRIPRDYPLVLDITDNRIGYEGCHTPDEKLGVIEIPHLEDIVKIETFDNNIYNVSYKNRTGMATDEYFYSVLACKVSLAINDPVKLPKRICNLLDANLTRLDETPFGKFALMREMADNHKDFEDFCFNNTNSDMKENQEKLLNALQYGWTPLKEQLYYVHLYAYGYLNRFNDGSFSVTDKNQTINYQTKFTMDEIIKMDERFIPFAEKVEY